MSTLVQAQKIDVTQFELSKAITTSRFFSKVKLSPSARLCLRCLVDFWNPNKGLVYPGQRTISECTGVSIRSINSAVEELRQQGLILTTGDKGERLKYYFSTKFFELLNISRVQAKSSQGTSAKIAGHEQIISNKKDNKSVSYNYKNKNYQTDKGIKYPSVEATRKLIKDTFDIKLGSPIDMPKEQALKWLTNLPPILKDSYYAKEVRKKWMI